MTSPQAACIFFILIGRGWALWLNMRMTRKRSGNQRMRQNWNEQSTSPLKARSGFLKKEAVRRAWKPWDTSGAISRPSFHGERVGTWFTLFLSKVLVPSQLVSPIREHLIIYKEWSLWVEDTQDLGTGQESCAYQTLGQGTVCCPWLSGTESKTGGGPTVSSLLSTFKCTLTPPPKELGNLQRRDWDVL